MSPGVSVVAIIAAYNEADIIEQVILDLIDQGIGVHVIDDGSTDETVRIAERHLGRGVLAVERLAETMPGDGSFSLGRILRRKTDLAAHLDADWFINHDADEFRESPWTGVTLMEGIARVDAMGFNAIDFASFDFWPTADTLEPVGDIRESLPYYSPAADYDRLQIRAWKKTNDLDLVTTAGHEARFPGRRVFPIRFILRHYPIRGQAHGERKVLSERRPRFAGQEREQGWHVQYDSVDAGTSFVRDSSSLVRFDPAAVRIDLAVRHRGVEELESGLAAVQRSLDESRREAGDLRTELLEESGRLQAVRRELAQSTATLAERTGEIDAWRQRAEEVQKNADGLRDEVRRRSVVIGNLEGTVRERSKRLDELYASRSWRWMAPARAFFRLLGGK